MTNIIIITDLDGTLLHPVSYSFEDAVPALEEVREANIPVVLCSSKTKAEIEVYRRRINNRDPFISENGGGIFIPEGYFFNPVEGRRSDGFTVITLGETYSVIRGILHDIRDRTGIRVRGFGDMSPDDVALITGMQLSDAGLSKQRDFDEPFIFEEGEDRVTEFLNEIGEAGLEVLAIVLYRGASTRAQIDYIRGVNTASTLRNLLSRGLLERAGNPEDAREYLYRPTVELLAHLGVRNNKELPSHEEIAAELGAFEARAKSDAADEAA